MDVADTLRRGMEAHRQGKLQVAADLYQQVLRDEPTQADALHLLGFVSFQLGQSAVAIEKITQAIALAPTAPLYHYNLGLVRFGHNDLRGAQACFCQVLQLNPSVAEAEFQLGNIAQSEKKLADANDHFNRALQLNPKLVEARVNRANVLLSLDRLDDAMSECDRALVDQPFSAEAMFNRAIALRRLERIDEAIEQYQRLLQLAPKFTPAINNLANILHRRQQSDSARALFEHALANDPNHPEALFNLGTLLYETGNIDRAITVLRHAAAVQPNRVAVIENLAAALSRAGQRSAAIEQYRWVLSFEPRALKSQINLGNLLIDAGHDESARTCFLNAGKIDPTQWIWTFKARAMCPAIVDSDADIDAFRATLADTLQEFAADRRPIDPTLLANAGIEPPFHLQFHGRDDRPLRELYASVFADRFPRRDHNRSEHKPTVGFLITDKHEPQFIRMLARSLHQFRLKELDVVIFCSAAGRSSLVAQIAHDDIRFVTLPPDLPAIADAIAAEKIDLLYYWEVATDSVNYLLPFYRPAPIQVTSWGIQVTSGLPDMNYYLSSKWSEGPNAEHRYTERLLLLDTLLTDQDRIVAPAGANRAEFGLKDDWRIYLCAQNLGKIHPQFDAVLRSILEQDGNGRIVLTTGRSEAIRDRLQDRFARTLGKVNDRVVFLPRLGVEDYQQLAAVADVMLDPLYFGGVNTTYDSLSLHQPIVTLPWDDQRGRYTLGCLQRIGITETVANDAEDYVRIALKIANDGDYRHDLRHRLAAADEILFHDPKASIELEATLLRLIQEHRAAR